MKKLSIEEKAQRYDEALEMARKELLTCGSTDCEAARQIYRFFPELKESEDEKIRKELLDYCKNKAEKYPNDPKYKNISAWIAWLEKRGEQPRYSIGDVLCDKSCTTLNKDAQPNFEIIDIRNGMYICDKGSFPISQQDEYELVAKKIDQKPADKVEPKFHEGDWVVNRFGDVWHIDSFDSKNYQVSNGDKYCYFPIEKQNEMHLWAIQDAKDGDVLACPLPKGHEGGEQIFMFKGINSRDYVDDCIEYYCRVCEGVFYENKTGYMGTTSSILYPATKEQCDVLMKAMANAGWTFDFEKKELKKIDSPVLSNSSNTGKDEPIKWSEEDKKVLEDIEEAVINYWGGDTQDIILDWLKSLKGRVLYQNQWKPSEEQMKALSEASGIVGMLTPRGTNLQSLYNDLKKLK